jgi:dipeptidyl aminopeptidase/acylaminoacyl peptidase
VYERVKYPAPLGKYVAYVTPVRKDGKKRPAMVWIRGGFDWSIDDSAWRAEARNNDQSARAFHEAGMVEMLPSLRGCNDNPGDHEYFLGEVDDVLAAIDALRTRPDVDPTRIYLGGHSTGATLALLVAASEPAVRAVFAFGPIAWIKWYGKTGTALDSAAAAERTIRSPAASLGDARVPVFIIEGQRGKVSSFDQLRAAAGKAPVRFFVVRGADHFSALAPVTELIAARLVRESEGGPAFDLTESELAGAVGTQ